jgi:hypothetical protein
MELTLFSLGFEVRWRGGDPGDVRASVPPITAPPLRIVTLVAAPEIEPVRLNLNNCWTTLKTGER